MKRLVIYSTFIIFMVLVLSGCGRNDGIKILQPVTSPSKTDLIRELITSTSTKTQESYLNLVTYTPVPTKTIIHPTFSTTVVPRLTNILDGKLILIRDFNVNYMEDILTGIGHNLLAEGQSIDILKWEGNGCTLIVRTESGIVEMDLQGKILRTIFPFERLPLINDGVILIPPSYGRRAIDILSPDGYWISYKVGSGNVEQRGDDLEPIRYDYEDLETISIDGTKGPYRLSQRGGAWRAAWSPDSTQIAYSDYDDQGNHQLFVISKDGSNRRQLTSFIDMVEIRKIMWSPNGEKIAAVVGLFDDMSADYSVVINIDAEISSEEYNNVIAEWWRDDDSIIAYQIVEQESRHAEIIVSDIISSKISTIRSEGCFRIKPFGNPFMIGCMTEDDKLSSYNSYTSEVVEYPKFDRHLSYVQYWIAAPDSYPGAIG